jgi:uncharacterized protein (DUF983 family)
MPEPPFTEYRRDGWPRCPRCGEDELWSRLWWDGEDKRPPVQAWIDAGLRCYRCQWHCEAVRQEDVP